MLKKITRHLSPRIKRFQKNCKGQVTIFFAMTLVLLVTCLAFVVNVGMFVKAKINLQNAVDAAAWSGAAVQARQLSNIAYLNWEMRNVYKEWMFKYYVLGQLSNPRTNYGSGISWINGGPSDGGTTDFKLRRFQEGQGDGDYYNMPSTCIHFAGTDNICAIYSLPGIPRFGSLGLVSFDDTHKAFEDVMVRGKSSDCSRRSDINFLTSMTWSFGLGEGHSLSGAPELAADRVGAWPKAFELALRLRNLEHIVNAPPLRDICVQNGDCQNPVTKLQQKQGETPFHERTVKAFWSAYRNLENNDNQRNLKHTLRLRELPPREVSVQPSTLNGILIPQAATKYYLDLRLELINYATFYTLFTAFSGGLNIDGDAVDTQGDCAGTKTALPVPGYPFGVNKNPDLLTYYALQAEADYTGLFNPFSDAVKLQAFAAAKPFGGRIGPMLFSISRENPQHIEPRDINTRSFSYLSGLKIGGTFPATTSYKRGHPMPLDQGFWVSINGTQRIGGNPSVGEAVYSIPNLFYDFKVGGSPPSGGTNIIQEVEGRVNPSDTEGGPETAGLYRSSQYQKFRKNLSVLLNGASTISPSVINRALFNAISPTGYEAVNYMIPNSADQDGQTLAPPIVPGSSSGGPIPYYLFAPLYHQLSLYPDDDNVKQALNNYIDLNSQSVLEYTEALRKVATEIKQESIDATGGLTDSADLYNNAANSIYPSGGLVPGDCSSLAGKFNEFFRKDGTGCPANGDTGGQVSLVTSIISYWNQQKSQNRSFESHYISSYQPPLNEGRNSPISTGMLLTAYLPGTLYGATTEGVLPHPFFPETERVDKNYYSTKLIPMQSLFGDNSFAYAGKGGWTSYSEFDYSVPQGIDPPLFNNQIDKLQVDRDLKNNKE